MFFQEQENVNYQPQKFDINKDLRKRREFSTTEVGLTHNDHPSFVRLTDNGDIEIFAAPGVGIVISGQARSISFFADTIKFFSKEDGLRWNNYNFNYSSSDFCEPALTKIEMNRMHNAVNNISHYLDRLSDIDKEELQKPVTISGDYGFYDMGTITAQNTADTIDMQSLLPDQVELLASHAALHSAKYIEYMAELMINGFTFTEADERAKREISE
jgi:hypothetical protein